MDIALLFRHQCLFCSSHWVTLFVPFCSLSLDRKRLNLYSFFSLSESRNCVPLRLYILWFHAEGLIANLRTMVNESFFHLRIVGLRTIGDTEVPLVRRIFWSLATSSCLVLALWYVVDRTGYFIVNPVQSSITLVEEQELALPDVTVCSR